MEDGIWKMEDGKWKMEYRRWKMENGKGSFVNRVTLAIEKMYLEAFSIRSTPFRYSN